MVRELLRLIQEEFKYQTFGLRRHEMHMDMTGGATVIGALQTISKLGLKKNVIGLVAAAGNAVSANAMRSGGHQQSIHER